MSAVTWTPTANLQWMKRQPPAGVTLPPGESTMVLEQWWVSSDGRGEWRDLPVRHFGQVYSNPPV